MPAFGGCSSSGDPSLAESLGTTELGLVSRVATVRAHDGLSVSTGVFSMPRLSTEIAPDMSIVIVTSSGIEIPSTPPPGDMVDRYMYLSPKFGVNSCCDILRTTTGARVMMVVLLCSSTKQS